MAKVAIITDSNSGITQREAAELGIMVLPMPFDIDGKEYYEDIDLTQEKFYEILESDHDISTSQPSPSSVTSLWDKALEDNDEIVYIPMSSGLSGSCQTAILLAGDYDKKVEVVNNQRISVTQRQSVLDAMEMASAGYRASEIKRVLEEQKFASSIYIMVDTLKYLKKGGRITPAAAALGTLLKLKPVLQIQGEKLDAFGKARTVKQAKTMMINALKKDMETRIGKSIKGENVHISVSYTPGDGVDTWIDEVKAAFPDHDIFHAPLSLSVSCHIGPGALAVTVTEKLKNLKNNV